MKINVKIKIGAFVFIVLLLLIYTYLVIFGLKISIPRKEMAKAIPINGEFVYRDEQAKERETLILSVELGNSHSSLTHMNIDGLETVFPGGKCFAEIHSNGWMKIFYCWSKVEEHSIISNYDFIGRKFLLTPWEYNKLMEMAKQIENESITAEELIDYEIKYLYAEGEPFYPLEYTYGVEGMPIAWECQSYAWVYHNDSYGRIFFNGHWYMENEITEPLIKEFGNDNNWITKQVQKERDEIDFVFGWDNEAPWDIN